MEARLADKTNALSKVAWMAAASTWIICEGLIWWGADSRAHSALSWSFYSLSVGLVTPLVIGGLIDGRMRRFGEKVNDADQVNKLSCYLAVLEMVFYMVMMTSIPFAAR